MFVRELVWSEIAEAVLRDAVGLGTAVPRYGELHGTRLVGWLADGVLAAAAGLVVDERAVRIGHIAARTDQRGRGYGAALVQAIADDVAPLPLVAETDDDAVDFYRRVGFAVGEIDSPYPTPRYRCILS